MTFEPWLKAYELLNKRLTGFTWFRQIAHTTQKGRILIAYKAYIAFMVFVSMIALVASTITSFI
jgi:hypothetical protein